MRLISILALVLAWAAAASGAEVPGKEDTFATEPVDQTYAQRRQAFIELSAERSPSRTYPELSRLELGLPVAEEAIRRDLVFIQERRDTADFKLHGVLRLLYQFGDSPLLSDAIKQEARETVLGFKYWPDEPGIDSMCTWSENHYILFSSGGYLTGQLYPEATFGNSGMTGAEQMARNRPRILKWIELRYKTGFSEWLSNVYYDEDAVGLLNLIDFCEDPEIVQRATLVMDLLLADMALNSFRGVMGSTHGRTYEDEKKHAYSENTSSLQKLAFGTGIYSPGSMSGTCLALSRRYQVPPVFEAMTRDAAGRSFVHRQRMGIRIAQADRWGLRCDNYEDVMHLLTLEAYLHPQVIRTFVDMLEDYNWWENEFFEPIAENKDMVMTLKRLNVGPMAAGIYEKDFTRNTREEVNIYTYRTPEYMLSTAQDYRAGYGGDQQHVWQATLAPEAVCFTTHPSESEVRTPDYWTGSGILPRAAQIENVNFCVYDLKPFPALYVPEVLNFTHAWLPREAFDEVVEAEDWIFARKGEGYLALRSQHPYRWQTEGEDAGKEIIVEGRRNIWICEMGSQEESSGFEAFRTAILAAPLRFGKASVRYDSPSQGRLRFGWHGALRQNGRVVKLDDYPRYDNPYVQAPFPPDQVRFECGDEYLNLQWAGARRAFSGTR
jgi:hypothetical protein